MLAVPWLGKRPIKVPNLKPLKLFCSLPMSTRKEFYQNGQYWKTVLLESQPLKMVGRILLRFLSAGIGKVSGGMAGMWPSTVLERVVSCCCFLCSCSSGQFSSWSRRSMHHVSLDLIIAKMVQLIVWLPDWSIWYHCGTVRSIMWPDLWQKWGGPWSPPLPSVCLACQVAGWPSDVQKTFKCAFFFRWWKCDKCLALHGGICHQETLPIHSAFTSVPLTSLQHFKCTLFR